MAKILSIPQKKLTTRRVFTELQEEDIQSFVLQDTISTAVPSKKLANKRFLRGSYKTVYQKYEESDQFHRVGKASASTVYRAARKVVKVEGKIPTMECLCETDENLRYGVLSSG